MPKDSETQGAIASGKVPSSLLVPKSAVTKSTIPASDVRVCVCVSVCRGHGLKLRPIFFWPVRREVSGIFERRQKFIAKIHANLCISFLSWHSNKGNPSLSWSVSLCCPLNGLILCPRGPKIEKIESRLKCSISLEKTNLA